jgi:RND family efflux transporter MFP subunit
MESFMQSNNQADINKDTSIPRSSLRIGIIALATISIIIVAAGVTTRANNNSNLKEWTEKQAVPTVSIGLPVGAADGASLDLPGRFEAYARAPIYARVSGYLKSWKVDIGSTVKAGQLLAEIETPDLDQQLLQARADVDSAQANVGLAETTAKRWQELLSTQSISKQEVDEKTSDYISKQAILKATEANLNRILALKNYTRIVAPFDGSVTARNTDTGALINAGSGTDLPLFEISDTHKLRLYINVPQNYVASIKWGTEAQITVPENPDKTYTAIVESTSGSIDSASGTTLMQLAVPNPTGALLSGGYANVSLVLPVNKTDLSVPASALIFDQAGLRVATVDSDNKVNVKQITIARDLGKTIVVHSGLLDTDRVVENPPDGIKNGDRVNIAESINKDKT